MLTTERLARGARRYGRARLRGGRRRARGDHRVPGAPRRPGEFRAAAAARVRRLVLAAARIAWSCSRISSTTPTSARSSGRPRRSAGTPCCSPRGAPTRSIGARSARRWARCSRCRGRASTTASAIEELHRRRVRDRGAHAGGRRRAARRRRGDPRVALVVGSEGPGAVDPVARRRRPARADPDARRGRFAQRRRGRGDRACTRWRDR